jgi:hypothetical protein
VAKTVANSLIVGRQEGQSMGVNRTNFSAELAHPDLYMLCVSADLPKLDPRRHWPVTAFRIIVRHGFSSLKSTFLTK